MDQKKNGDNEPYVSVYILSYYHEEYIVKALESVLCQETDYSFEIVIADDCSQDKTPEILEEYRLKYPGIIRVFINKENLGISLNHLNCIKKCRGKYLIELDGDDCFIDKNKIQDQVSFMESNKGYLCASTVLEIRDSCGNILGHTPDKELLNTELTLNQFMQNINFPTTGMVIRNIFKSEYELSQLELMAQVSRNIDDLTLCIIILRLGRVFLGDKCTYAHYSRRKTGLHNYNSYFSAMKILEQHIELLNGLFHYLSSEIDFTERYSYQIKNALKIAIRKFKWKWFLSIYKQLPSLYRTPFRKSVLLKSIKAIVFGQ